MARSWLLAVLLLPAFAGCTGAGAPFTVDEPQWLAGYAFSYRTDGHYDYQASGEGIEEKESGDVPPSTEIVEVLNTTLLLGASPAYLVAIGYADPPSGSESSRVRVQLGAVRKADLARLRVDVTAGSSCNEGVCIHSISKVSPHAGPDAAYLDFPLTRGKTWAGLLSTLDEDLDAPGLWDGLELITTARAVGRRSIETPLGRVQAIQVDLVTTPANLDQYLKELRQEATREGVRVDVLQLEASARTRLWYSPDHLAVVKSETLSTSHAQASGREKDGDKFDFRFSSNVRVNQLLTGARLVQRAERDLAYAARLLFGKSPILDPSGLTPVPIDYSLDLSASTQRANAAEAETVNFTTRVLGQDRLPDGHKLQWRIRGLDGNTTAQGEGATFAHAFQEPGEYAIEIEGRNAQGNLTASDGLSVVADYVKTLRVDCPDVSFERTPGNCPTEAVPIRFGIRSLRITARIEPGAPAALPVASRELLLYDAADRVVARDPTPANNVYSIDIAGFADREVDGRDYKMQLAHRRSLLEDATYHVELLYSEKPLNGSDPKGATVPSAAAWLRAGLLGPAP